MRTQTRSVAARFDLAKAGSESNCWQVFWRAVKPEDLRGASIYEGAASKGSYCIAVRAADLAIVDGVRQALSGSSEFGAVCWEEPFLDEESFQELELPRSGKVDEEGRLIGDEGRLRPEASILTHAAVWVDEDVQGPKRTQDLPPVASLEGLQTLLRERFSAQHLGYARAVWVTPEELADLVEAYDEVVSVSLSEHPSAFSENVLHVRLFDRAHPELEPIELEGLFAFTKRSDVTAMLSTHWSSRQYAEELPALAGIVGRYQLHLGTPHEAVRSLDYSNEEGVRAGELRARLRARREAFGDELERALAAQARRSQQERLKEEEKLLLEEAIRQQEEQQAEREAEEHRRRAEEALRKMEEQRQQQEAELARRRAEIEQEVATQERRKAEGRCIYCGVALGMADRLRKRDRHPDCWQYQPDA